MNAFGRMRFLAFYMIQRVEERNPRGWYKKSKSTPNTPNQEINGMNACRRSPGMNALMAFPVWYSEGFATGFYPTYKIMSYYHIEMV